MFNIEEININKMIVHILDSRLNTPVLSKEEIESSYEVKEFFANHIIKTLNDDSAKDCNFNTDYNQTYLSINDFALNNNKFIDMSIDVATRLFAIMSTNIDIPSGDLAVIHFSYRRTECLALLKLNYNKSYIHRTGNSNSIIQYRATLPNIGQKINEAAIINLSTMDIRLLEKKYEIDGNKEYYLSQYLLKCTTNLSSKEQYNIVKKATNTITKKYFNGDAQRQIDIKQEIYNNIGQDGDVNLEKFSDEVFKNNQELKKEFLETVSQKGINQTYIHLSEKTITRSLEHHKIKTDLGVEIKVPIELWETGSVKFVVEPDGKQTIVIKNNNKIMSN